MTCEVHIPQQFQEGFWCARCKERVSTGKYEECIWVCPECFSVAVYTPGDKMDKRLIPTCCWDWMHHESRGLPSHIDAPINAGDVSAAFA